MMEDSAGEVRIMNAGIRVAWRRLALLLLLTVAPGFASQSAGEILIEARRLFLEIERTARQPRASQSAQLSHLYRDVCRQWEQRPFIAAFSFTGFSTAPEAGETAEDLADRLERSGGWPWLAMAGQRRCRDLMAAHRDKVESMVREDLKSERRQTRQWALRAAGEMKLRGLYDEVVAAFRGPEPELAPYTLRDLDDPRAIPLLIQSSPNQPTLHYEILRHLQRNRPAHLLLLELLRSDNATERRQAAYALSESRDPKLVPVVERLSSDPSAEVRRQAGNIGFLLHEADYRRVHKTMIALLSDPEVDVRSDVAFGMASRQDRACAPALLDLVRQEDTLDNWRQSNTVQAIQTLTGTYFGLTPGTPSPPDVRRKAIAEFAQWIKEHGAP